MSGTEANTKTELDLKTPWWVTPQLVEEHGLFAPYVAWEAWMQSQLRDETADEFSDLDTVLKANIYAAMVEACCHAAGIERNRSGPVVSVTIVSSSTAQEAAQ